MRLTELFHSEERLCFTQLAPTFGKEYRRKFSAVVCWLIAFRINFAPFGGKLRSPPPPPPLSLSLYIYVCE